MVCRDWASTLRRASYRGAPFFVESDNVETGRRLVVHEFPHKDAPYVEDMGRRANVVDVTAYVAGEDVETVGGRLFNACHQGGAAQLNLPTDRMQAHCESCAREYSKDRLGYIAFRLRFIRHGAGAAPASIGGGARAIEFAASGLVVQIGDAYAQQFKTLKEAGFVLDDATARVQEFAADFEAELRTSLIDAELVAPLLLQTSTIYNTAAELTLFGAVGDTFGERSYSATSQTVVETGLVSAVFDLITAAREALDPDMAPGFLVDWTQWGEVPTSSATPSLARLKSNATAINNVVRFSAAAQYATAIVNRTYTDPRDARQARADAAEYLGSLLDDLSGWATYEIGKEIYALRGMIADHLTTLLTTLAPVLVVSAPRRMPSLWWANRLYADAERAGEIAQRNSVKHASFMPTEFEALSR